MALQTEDIKILEKIFACDKQSSISDSHKDGAFDSPSHSNIVYLPAEGKEKNECTGFKISTSEHDLTGYQFHFKFHCMSNPDGSIRWLYPTSKPSSALVFYNTSSTRSWLISKLIKTLSSLGLGGVLKSEALSIYSNEIPTFLKAAGQETANDIAIFTGTKGMRRNALVSVGKEKKAFIKIPLETASLPGLMKEREMLNVLNLIDPSTFKFPKINCSGKDYGINVMNDIRPKNSTRKNSFTKMHADAIGDLGKRSRSKVEFRKAIFWEKINSNLSMIETMDYRPDLLMSLKKLRDRVEESAQESIVNHFAHGDFTPWNIYADEQKLYVYDWEYGLLSAPALYDMFHFIYQNGVLSENQTDTEIVKAIYEVLDTTDLLKRLSIKKSEVRIYQSLYFLHYVSSQLCDYAHEQSLSVQNLKQLKHWETAVIRLLKTVSYEGFRDSFLNDFDKHLMPVNHAFLKFDEESLVNISPFSDVDLVVEQSAIDGVISFCNNNCLVKNVKVIRKSFMTSLEIDFLDGGFLSIDLLNEFKRKNLLFMTAKEVLKGRKMTKRGFLVPAAKHDLEYLFLFYGLNGADIPEKYKSYYERKLAKRKEIVKKEIMVKHIGDHDHIDFWKHSDDKKKVLIMNVRKYKCNQGWNRVVNTGLYVLDTIKDLVLRRGFVVTFSGVDGAGKTTVINRVKDQIGKRFRRDVVLLRHRPGILPILSAITHGKVKAEKIAGSVKPRQGKNKNMVSSALRFAYYFTDYFLGQFYVYFKYLLRGTIVVYDRYYFDFINDARRSNINIDRGVTKMLYGLLIKPKMNYFLYADPYVIMSRKQETSMEDIVEITQRYRGLFKEYDQKFHNSSYVSIRNENLSETIDTILTRLG